MKTSLKIILLSGFMFIGSKNSSAINGGVNAFIKNDNFKSSILATSAKSCLYLYKESNGHVAGSYSWKLKASNNASGKIGVTYAQKLGLNTTYSTVTITIAPGQIKDLGYGQFGYGDPRHVWIEAAWWE